MTFSKLQIKFQFNFPLHLLTVGKIKDIAFIKDPDGYWIEIFDTKTIAKTTAKAAV